LSLQAKPSTRVRAISYSPCDPLPFPAQHHRDATSPSRSLRLRRATPTIWRQPMAHSPDDEETSTSAPAINRYQRSRVSLSTCSGTVRFTPRPWPGQQQRK